MEDKEGQKELCSEITKRAKTERTRKLRKKEKDCPRKGKTEQEQKYQKEREKGRKKGDKQKLQTR